MAQSRRGNEPVAIVGSSCRFPGPAKNISKLWELLQNPRDIAREVPADRFDIDAFYHPDGEHHGTVNCREAYFLEDDVRQFDAAFFQVHPREAETMDPQQRLLLETVYEAMESAGLTVEGVQGSATSVYVGGMSYDFRDAFAIRDPDSIPEYSATGTHASILSARIAYFFDLRGPTMSIDTACSSSLVAVHHAVQSLQSGEATAAVAAGSNLNLGPEQFVALGNLHMLSPNGRVRMWDDQADGYARGEGFGAVILKTLSQALADGDHIQCLIRGSGVNQDGRTTGITMPNPDAQAALMRQVYERAGLDINNPADQPQFFEAHGTGTPAGDPLEASAIHRAFIQDSSQDATPLYVGSVKTVIGHLEGAAGIAGLIKASLAVSNGVIPPNLHFQSLNPKIKPYYGRIQIPQTAMAWPELPSEAPRRASVNSFGFGGTNAHVILEEFQAVPQPTVVEPKAPVTPILISAKSEKALLARMEALQHYARSTDASAEDVAYTLQSHRSNFAFRASCVGSTLIDVAEAVEARQFAEKISTRVSTAKHRLLGVFTGQGAQHARMGAELIEQSAGAHETLTKLEKSLASLSDPPSWSLTDELLAEESQSRLGEAQLSQPLCTAIQIVLVDHLKAAGVEFDAVVGHSSGEIAAAYAAGYLSAEDAIRIAYYRGVHAGLARGNEDKAGGMMAVAMSFEETQRFCSKPTYQGRLYAAASNAPSSSTISGDTDAIDEAKEELENQQKFARRLLVDTAYHSFHMDPCADPYTRSLENCGVRAQIPTGSGCRWISSVYESGNPMERQSLNCGYWKDNLTNPVLFSHALTRAAADLGPFDSAVEVGPHPALKGPALVTIPDSVETYIGTLRRKQDSVLSMAHCLGSLWEHLGRLNLDFESYKKMWFGQAYRKPKMLADLPPYPWDHDKVFYRESRASNRYLHGSGAVHALLGRRLPDSSNHEVRWRNIISLKEAPWINDHKVQGQAVVPAMWYIVMALEAGVALAGDANTSSIEIRNFEINRALTLESNTSLETVFSIRTISHSNDILLTEFSCASANLYGDSQLSLVFSGQLHLHAGPAPSDRVTPAQQRRMNPMLPDQFYNFLDEVGYGYSGDFRMLTEIQKKGSEAKASARCVPCNWTLHPATLDLALQSLLAAHFTITDNSTSLVVPQSIERLVVHVGNCKSADSWSYESLVTEKSPRGIYGDVDAYADDGSFLVSLENVFWKPITARTPAEDRNLFTKTVWESDISSKLSLAKCLYSRREEELVHACDRVAWFYYRHLYKSISPQEWSDSEWHHQRLLKYLEHMLPNFASGAIPTVDPTWINDTKEDLSQVFNAHPDSADLKLMRAVGESLATAVREKRPMLEFMMEDNALTDYYKFGLGYEKSYGILETMVKHIAHRYPRMQILEVGAGTGGATDHVLKALNEKFLTYTFTDVSAGFFGKAQSAFAERAQKLLFKTFDLEKDPLTQGYDPASYDLIVGSLVVHATKDVEQTLRYIRSLLKPGGYILLVEGSEETLRSGFMMSGLPGWWVGGEDRMWGPMMNPSRWDSMLKRAGFSGIDNIAEDNEQPFTNLGSVFVSQAVDDQIGFLRDPLQTRQGYQQPGSLTVVGTKDDQMKVLQSQICNALQPAVQQLQIVASIEDCSSVSPPGGSTVLCLSELGDSIFERLTPDKMAGLKALFTSAERVLVPYLLETVKTVHSYTLMGLIRSLLREIPHLRIQTLGVDKKGLTGTSIAESALRLIHYAGTSDNNILWSFEPELRQTDGALRIPRIMPDAMPNSRLNSERRAITSNGQGRVNIQATMEDGALKMINSKADLTGSLYSISFSFTTLQKLPAGTNGLYMSIGRRSTGARILALVPERTSTAKLCSETMVEICDEVEDACVVECAANYLLATSLLSSLPDSGTVVLHNASESLQHALESPSLRGSKRSLKFLCTSSVPTPNSVHISQFTSQRQLRQHFSRRSVDAFIDVSRRGKLPPFRACFPHAKHIYLEEGMSHTVFRDAQRIGPEELHRALGDAAIFAQKQPVPLTASRSSASKHVGSEPLIQADNILQLVDWGKARSAPIDFQSVASTFKLFWADKTYLLVGLTGDMGQTLCEYMVRNGAKNVVLTSRNPTVDQDWIDWLSEEGATVKVYSLDVSDRGGMLDLRARMSNDHLPTVAGIANGAMVLRDHSFYGMTYEDMISCLAPKTEGSSLLDDVFSDTPLDFFILFSSIAWVVGNPGQSNYSAANGYMAALAEQRRTKGLAASVISLGVIGEVGYLARTRGGQEHSHAKRRNVMTISPEELCTVFSEAVVASPSTSGRDVELIVGLDGKIDTRQTPWESLASWLSDPRVSHLIEDAAEASIASGVFDKAELVPLRQQLSTAESSKAAGDILTTSFSTKLERMLMLQAGSVIKTTPLIEFGVDSLLAVDIRSWFISELAVDLPVLKILGGTTVAEAAEYTLSLFAPPASSEGADQAASEAVSTNAGPTEVASSESGPGTPDTESELNGFSRQEVASFAQRRMWRVHEFTSKPHVNNLSWAYRITGLLDSARFEQAFNAVTQPYEALRTRFFRSERDGKLQQQVLGTAVLRLQRRSVSSEDEVSNEFARLCDTEYDLKTGFATSAALLSLWDGSHVFMMGFHHIVIDTRSCEILLADLNRAYAAPNKFESPYLGAANHPADYAALEAKALNTGEWDESYRFWKDLLADAPLLLPLFPNARCKQRRKLEGFHMVAHHEHLSKQELARIEHRCKRELRCSPYHFHTAVLSALLRGLTGGDDAVIGSVDAGRDAVAGFADVFGPMFNYLPLRIAGVGAAGQTFHQLVRAARDVAYRARAHAQLPFDAVASMLGQARMPPTHHPVYQAQINYLRHGIDEVPLGDAADALGPPLRMKLRDARGVQVSYDFCVSVLERHDGARIAFETQEYLYGKDEVRQLGLMYMKLLHRVVADMDADVAAAAAESVKL